MILTLGRLMRNAIKLNKKEGVDVYLCLQGNTECLNVTVEENKTIAYQNRAFVKNKSEIRPMLKDIKKMKEWSDYETEIL